MCTGAEIAAGIGAIIEGVADALGVAAVAGAILGSATQVAALIAACLGDPELAGILGTIGNVFGVASGVAGGVASLATGAVEVGITNELASSSLNSLEAVGDDVVWSMGEAQGMMHMLSGLGELGLTFSGQHVAASVFGAGTGFLDLGMAGSMDEVSGFAQLGSAVGVGTGIATTELGLAHDDVAATLLGAGSTFGGFAYGRATANAGVHDPGQADHLLDSETEWAGLPDDGEAGDGAEAAADVGELDDRTAPGARDWRPPAEHPFYADADVQSRLLASNDPPLFEFAPGVPRVQVTNGDEGYVLPAQVRSDTRLVSDVGSPAPGLPTSGASVSTPSAADRLISVMDYLQNGPRIATGQTQLPSAPPLASAPSAGQDRVAPFVLTGDMNAPVPGEFPVDWEQYADPNWAPTGTNLNADGTLSPNTRPPAVAHSVLPPLPEDVVPYFRDDGETPALHALFTAIPNLPHTIIDGGLQTGARLGQRAVLRDWDRYDEARLAENRALLQAAQTLAAASTLVAPVASVADAAIGAGTRALGAAFAFDADAAVRGAFADALSGPPSSWVGAGEPVGADVVGEIGSASPRTAWGASDPTIESNLLGEVTRNKLNPSEVAQAADVLELHGGHFVGAPTDSFPGIDGWLETSEGFANPVSLKETSGGLSSVLRHASQAELAAFDVGATGVDLYIKAPNVTSGALLDFAGKGPLSTMPTQGTIRAIYVQTSDGWVSIGGP